MPSEQDPRRLLRRLLEQHGWSCGRVETVGQHWWDLQESWEVSSTWSPVGLRGWLLLGCRYDDLWGTVDASLGFASSCPERGQPWSLVFQIAVPCSFDQGVLGGKASRRRWGASLQPFLAQLDAWRNEHAFGAALTEAAQQESDARWWTEPAKWLSPHRPRLGERKWRLLACACLRLLPEVQEDEESLHVVAVAEQYADGLVRKRELRKARKASPLAWLPSYEAYDEAMAALERCAGRLPPTQRFLLGALLRDLEPCSLPPCSSWLRRNGGVVASMARVIYERRSFADLPILADALEDAGCNNEGILSHCRQVPAREHARGCHVLDWLLRKT